MTTHNGKGASCDRPPAQLESLEESAERVSQLFATTIKALAADVHALNQLTTWKDILLENEEDGSSTASHEDQREEFLESLCDLDDVVTAVEKKVGMLRQIVAEEQKALENMNFLHKDSLEQSENLQYLIERCRNMAVTNKEASKENKAKAKSNNPKAVVAKPHSQPSANHRVIKSVGSGGHPPLKTASSNASALSLGSAFSNGSGSQHEPHTHIEGMSCHFDAVTVEELNSVPRTTRGRLQVSVINEALSNIEKAFHKKAVKERRQQRLLEESRYIALGRSHEEPMDDAELLQNLVVTEQELRQSCNFFHLGEGTARTVLAVLKALRRIKQVPQKEKGLFMYKLCVD